MTSSENRVVVTGVGSVAPGCPKTASLWERLLSGESAVGPLRTGTAASAGCRLGAEVELIDKASLGISRKELRYLDVVSTYGLIAAQEAVASAGLDTDLELEREELGFSVGLFSGPLSLSRHESNVNLFSAAMSAYYGSVIGNITIPLRLSGPSFTHLNLDLAGCDAIGYGFELIRHGKARAVVAGGSDSGFNAFVLARLQQAGVLSKGIAADGGDGVVLGEGAALLVLESLESAERRGRRIYAEVLGYHTAHGGTDGCAVDALRAALAKAGVEPARVDCVVANATGYPPIDQREEAALRGVFGGGASRPVTTDITWAVGHTLGAAGALQAVASALILDRQQVPPAVHGSPSGNGTVPEPLERPAARTPIEVVIQNTFGFSGKSSFLVMGRYGGGPGDA